MLSGVWPKPSLASRLAPLPARYAMTSSRPSRSPSRAASASDRLPLSAAAGAPASSGKPTRRDRIMRLMVIIGPSHNEAGAGMKLFRPDALHDTHHAGLLERGGAQLEEKVRGIAPQNARRLVAVALDLLGDDRVGNAERRLPEAVLDEIGRASCRE